MYSIFSCLISALFLAAITPNNVMAEPPTYILKFDQSEKPYVDTSPHFYAGGEYGYTKNRVIGFGSSANDETGYNYGGFIGFKFNQYIGLELGYNRLDGLEKNSTASAQGITVPLNVKTTQNTYSLDLLGFIPVIEGRLNGIIGAGYERYRTESKGTTRFTNIPNESASRKFSDDAWRLTLGAEFLITEDLAARAVYRYHDYGDSDAQPDDRTFIESRNDFNIGLAWHF